MQNNYGQFKWVQGPISRPNATVANGDLKGIGKLAAELAESQETDNLSRGMHEQGPPMHNSHQPAHRKIESSFNANSYINNSSVAKTSMQKRRNISFSGAAPAPNNKNNYIEQQRPSIIDLESIRQSSNKRNVRQDSINKTYDGSTRPPDLNVQVQ